MAAPTVEARLPPNWRNGPFSVCMVDQDRLVKYTNVHTSIKYPDFLAVLHELTTDFAHLVPGLSVALDVGEGFSLRDGAWWYRVAHIGPPTGYTWVEGAGWKALNRPTLYGEWKVFDNFLSFQKMFGDFITTRKPNNGSWMEFQHQLQVDRDQQRQRSQPVRRRGPVIVDGSKAPPLQSTLPNDGRALVQSPVLPVNNFSVARKPNNSHINGTKPWPSTNRTVSRQELVDVGRSRRDNNVVQSKKTTTSSQPSRTPKLGMFPPPRPRPDHRAVSLQPAHQAVQLPSALPAPYNGQKVANVGLHGFSTAAKPMASTPRVEVPKCISDGPGPAISSSPQPSTLTLGSPLIPVAVRDGVPPPLRAADSLSSSLRVISKQLAASDQNTGRQSNKASRGLDPALELHPGRGLDPALDFNQEREPRATRRAFTNYLFPGLFRGDNQATSLARGISVEPNQTFGKADQAMQEDASFNEAARGGQTRNKRKPFNKTSKRKGQRQGQDGEATKKHERILENLEKQRDERKQRADRRATLKY